MHIARILLYYGSNNSCFISYFLLKYLEMLECFPGTNSGQWIMDRQMAVLIFFRFYFQLIARHLKTKKKKGIYKPRIVLIA